MQIVFNHTNKCYDCGKRLMERQMVLLRALKGTRIRCFLWFTFKVVQVLGFCKVSSTKKYCVPLSEPNVPAALSCVWRALGYFLLASDGPVYIPKINHAGECFRKDFEWCLAKNTAASDSEDKKTQEKNFCCPLCGYIVQVYWKDSCKWLESAPELLLPFPF